MPTVVVIYHSALGRTRALAKAVADGAAEIEGTTSELVSVDEGPRVHTVLGQADAIIFGCPTYMGSASAAFKAFMDSTSAVWALQGWRDKLAAAFTHSAAPSGDKLGTLTQLAIFAAQHGMVWVGLGLPPTYTAVESRGDEPNRLGSHLGMMAQSPPGGPLPRSDLQTASFLGRRVARAAKRWAPKPRPAGEIPEPRRHEAARGWVFPPASRPAPSKGIARTNLRELVARPERFEHHLVVCASIDDVQLEITAASEPLYFAHINFSDEYAISLQTGDELVDRFPLRTFLSDPRTGKDLGRYNHRIGDLVLHPEGYLHWPGRLRPPFEPFDFPPRMRRSGLSLVYCASRPLGGKPRPPMPRFEPISQKAPDSQEGETIEAIKAYVEPAPPMALSSLRGEPGPLATIGRTTLALIELPVEIAPSRGGWAVVLEASGNGHAAGDLYRIEAGARLEARGIVRALVLTSSEKGPDRVPPSWTAVPGSPIAPFEDGSPGTLPVAGHGLEIGEENGMVNADRVTVRVGKLTAQVPRYWLARLLFRVALHQMRLGYVETYGGFFVDDRAEDVVHFGLRAGSERETRSVPRKEGEALAFIDHLYRAIAPAHRGYVERPA
jgi:NAD(P)H dehydrogenase (quinone)